MKLKEFQEKIFSFMEGELPIDPHLHFVKEHKGIHRSDRLTTYKESFEARITGLIEKDFEVTGIFLGCENFESYIRGYFKAHPSKTHLINELSLHFPEYIQKNKPEGAAAFIDDLAHLERVMTQSFYDFFDFRKQPNPSADNSEEDSPNLQVNPSLYLVESDWPLEKIWNEEKDFSQESSRISVWTLEDRVMRIHTWPPLEFQILKNLKTNPNLVKALEGLPEEGPAEELAAKVERLFSTLVQQGIVWPSPAKG